MFIIAIIIIILTQAIIIFVIVTISLQVKGIRKVAVANLYKKVGMR